MSRLDLDSIQSQLKTAIQNHQTLVSRIQLQPQDMGLRTQLHNLQKEIMLMSQRQKHVVQKLRKDLFEGQSCSSEVQKVAVEPKLSPNSTVTQAPSPKGSVEPTCDKADEASLQPPHLPRTTACDTLEPPPIQKSAKSPLRVPQFLPNACRPNVPQTTISTTPTTIETKASCESKATPTSTVSQSAPAKRSSVAARSWSNGRDRHSRLDTQTEDPEYRKKLDFMMGLQLYPPDTLKEMLSKRSERKRRSTNNPNFAYGYELERRPRLSNYLGTEYFGAQKPKARQSTWKADGPSPKTSRSSTPVNGMMNNNNSEVQNSSKENKHMQHENLCRVCNLSGQLLLCDTCSAVYHLQCLSPPLAVIPESNWSCPKCQEAHHRSALSLAAVTTYIASKTGKEEEKRKLLKRSNELLQEKTNLENRTKELNEILARQGIQKKELIDINRKAQETVEHLKNFVKIVQSS